MQSVIPSGVGTIPKTVLDHQALVYEQADAYIPSREVVLETEPMHSFELWYRISKLRFEPHIVVA